MSLFDKRLTKEKRESLELAEESREKEWMYPSFVLRLFQGALEWNLIYPFPEQKKEEKEDGDRFLKQLEEFLKENLNPDEADETREIPERVIKGLAKMGAFAMKIPKEYNGLGFSQLNYNRAIHLIGTYCGSTAALLSAHQSIGVPQPLILFGTEEQKRKYLPKFRQGAISGFALTEEDAGSDPRMMKTTATPTEDGKFYILNGEKLWCTNGPIADVLLIMAYTPSKMVEGKEKKQITAFIVETNTPGFEVTYRCKFMGLNAIQNGVFRLNNVKVPKENILGGEGEGLKLAFVTLNTGRLTLPAAVTGVSKWALYVSRIWANERRQWGSSIGEHESIAEKLSYIASTVLAMEAMVWFVSHLADNQRFDIRLEAAIAKLFCTEESWKIINQAIQIRGGRGYETATSLRGRGKPDYPLERVLRDMRVNTILEGSSEIMHLFIAREALDFHLKAMKALLDPRVPIAQKILLVFPLGFKYLLWYLRLWIPDFFVLGLKLKEPLRGHIQFVKKTARRLAREIFHKMILYQHKLANKQNTLFRFVDIGMDLFAISCVCSYADSLARKGKENSIGLADLFCRMAKARIKDKFEETSHNQDRLSNSIAKKILKGEFEWLETDIIKGRF